MSIESDTYDFLKEKVEAIADEAHPLFEVEVLRDEYEEITKARSIRIGKCVSQVAPNPGQSGVKHFDASLVLIFSVRVDRGMKQERFSFREAAIQMAEAAAMLFFDEPDMGGRQDDSRPYSLPRGSDDTDSLPYAIANLYVVINETGNIEFGRRRE